MADPDIKDLQRRMDGAIDALQREFAGLRTGRASIHLLEPITVEAYGASMPLSQVGTIGVPEPRMITVQVWDRSLVGGVERAIRDSGLGLNPWTISVSDSHIKLEYSSVWCNFSNWTKFTCNVCYWNYTCCDETGYCGVCTSGC